MARQPKTLTQRIALDGGDEIKAELEALGRAGERAFAQLKAAADSTVASGPIVTGIKQIRTSFADLQTATAKVRERFGQLRQSFIGLGAAFASVATRLTLFTGGVTGAVAALGFMARSAASNAEAVRQTADAFGLGVEQAQLYGEAMTRAGGDTGLLDRTLTTLVTKLNDTGKATENSKEKMTDAEKATAALNTQLGDLVDKSIGVVRTHDDIADAAKGTGEAFKGTFTDLEAFGRALDNIGTRAGRIQAIVARGFSRREAVTLNAFFRNLTAGARAAIGPLSELETEVLDDLDDRFDTLGISIIRLRDRLVALSATTIGNGLRTFEQLLADNQAAIIAFATKIRDAALPVIQEFFAALTGNDEDVARNLDRLADGIIAFGATVRRVITGVVVPLFRGFIAVLNSVATAINFLFGTNITGGDLAVTLAVLKLIGVFKVLGATVRVLTSTFKFFFALIFSTSAQWVALRGLILGAATAVRGLSAALLAFVAANPIILAIGALAAAIFFLATRQTLAEKNTEAHAEAVGRLQEAMANVAAGVPGAVDAFKRIAEAEIAAAEAAIAFAEGQARAAQILIDTQDQRGINLPAGAAVALAESLEGLAVAKANLQEIRDLIASIESQKIPDAKAAADEFKKAIGSANKETSGLDTTTGNLTKGVEDLGSKARTVTPKVINVAEALGDVAKSSETLKTLGPTAETAFGTVASSSATTATGILEGWGGVKTLFDELWASITTGSQAAFNTLTTGFASVRDLSLGVAEATVSLGEGLQQQFVSASTGIQEAWAAMVASMVEELQSLVGHAESVAVRLSTLLTSAFSGIEGDASGAIAFANAIVQPFKDAEIEIRALIERLFADVRRRFEIDLQGLLSRIAQAIATARAQVTAGERFGAPSEQVVDVTRFSPLIAAAQEAARQIVQIFASIDTTALASGITDAFVAQLALIPPLFQQFTASLIASFQGVTTAFQNAVGGLPAIAAQIAAAIVQAFSGLAVSLQSTFASVVAAIRSEFESLASSVEAVIARLTSALARLRSAIASARAAAASSSSTSRATGGYIQGPGTGTSDSIPAWLSTGEFVIRAAAVRKLGVRFLHALNSGRLSLEDLLARLAGQHFNLGGLADGLSRSLAMPRYAAGGLVLQAASPQLLPGKSFDLHIGADVFRDLFAPSDTADALVRFMTRKTSRRAGRAPTWKR